MASCPTFWATLAAIGTADTPAAPINGFTFPPVALHIIFPNITPAAVPMEKAISPNIIIFIVPHWIKISALAVAPTVNPRNTVTIFINSFCTVLDNLSTTPDSLIRLPNINIPTNGPAEGNINVTTTAIIMGNIIFSFLDTGRSCSITIFLSSSVVNAFIIGGCIIGTNAM